MMEDSLVRLTLSLVFLSTIYDAATAQVDARRGDTDVEGLGVAPGTTPHPETEIQLDYDQFVYNPHIVINPPKFSTPLVPKACCNCSTFREIVSAETARLEETYRRLRDDTRIQLQQLQAAMTDLADILRSLPETNITPPSLLPQSLDHTKTTASEMEHTTSTTVWETTTQPPPPPVTTLPKAQTTKATSKPTTQPEPTTSSTASTSKATTVAIFKDCSDALAMGVTSSGVYKVKPLDGGADIEVYCDMNTDGGGWTVFQRRKDGSVDFYRDFDSYRQGFGDVDGEFWLGNDNLHRLTSQDDYILRVDLTDFQGNSVYAVYSSFRVADLSDNYRLTLGQYSGTAGDSLTRHSNKPFTTKDRDNDEFLTGNCARVYHGAWWYERCHQSNLNGNYLGGPNNRYAQGVVWRRWKGYNYSLKTSEMKFRKKTN
ncbi:techylectin-5A-like isoform X2 [Acanthaster planci]|uniref:Techylectin-5A-like isoform X2 n=1 Tax=Acanthaster planci TaxID=133434 RepID=A0A8B7ZAQ2_ACAPL|nr:techylectin-5A-like isoform X2 [Acanthaster planci]